MLRYSGKTCLLFQFVFNVALHSNNNVIFICYRLRLDSKPPFLSQVSLSLLHFSFFFLNFRVLILLLMYSTVYKWSISLNIITLLLTVSFTTNLFTLCFQVREWWSRHSQVLCCLPPVWCIACSCSYWWFRRFLWRQANEW